MDDEIINALIISRQIKKRTPDLNRSRSLQNAAQRDADIAVKMTLTKDTATIIFKTLYDCIRQCGDARWWRLGYESCNHDVSLEILPLDRLQLSRLKRIRNDATYRGYTVSVEQAKEIIDFWKRKISPLEKQQEND